MVRHGTCHYFAFRFSLLGVFFAVLFLSVSSWGDCYPTFGYIDSPLSQCSIGIPDGWSCSQVVENCRNVTGSWNYNLYNCVYTGSAEVNGRCHFNYTGLCCENKCEALQQQCENEGGTWVPSSDPNECGYCDLIDTTLCDEPRRSCQNLGGRFSGSVIHTSEGDCCSGSCDLCNAQSQNKLWDVKRALCCDDLKAPPDPVTVCYTPTQSGCGITTSVYSDSTNDWECRDPNLDQATKNRYMEVCSDDYSSFNEDFGSSDSQGSSSSFSSSSSDGGNSSGGGSSGGDSDCPECPLLDEVIDTLHDIHLTVGSIYMCLTNSKICPSLSPEIPEFHFDTAFRKYLQPLLDSMLELDSNQLKALLKLDTNALKALRNDSALLENDSSTRIQIVAGFHTADTNFLRLRDGVWQMDSAMQQHLQELISKIPDSILDSIRKYQDSSIDLLDTALFGENVGFSLVDSLIDSAVKYFQLSTHYDSVYNVLFGDSIGSLHAEISDLPGRNASAIGSALGYGDTASTNLRGDLQGIKDAITDGFGGLDSAWGDGEAPSDTVGDGPYGGFDDGSDSVGNDYLQTLGGLLDSAINDTGVFNPIFGRDSGFVDWDSAYSLPDVDSLKAHLDSSIIVQRSEIEDSLQAGFDSLKGEFMLLNYDSLILAPLGVRVPNTNTCPAHCFQFEIGDGSGYQYWLGSVGSIDFGLCKPLPGFSFDVLYLIRIVGRLLTALFCVYIGLWFIAGRKN